MSTVEIPHDEEVVVVTPVPITGEVHLTGRVPTSEEAADFGAYRTVVLVGTEDKQQILPYDKHRVRAYVQCVPAVVTNVQASNVFAGAAAGSVSLPVGASITGIYLDFQAPGSAVNGDVTVTNVAGGTMTFRIVLQAANGNVFVPFPNPLPAASSGVAPTVNVPAIATGPAYSITVTGQTTTGSGPVYLGTEAQCAQVKSGNTAAAGWVLASGGPALPVTHKQPVWLVPDGSHSATVVVIQERMQS